MLVAILPSCQCHAVHGVFNGLFAFDDNLNFFALPLLMTYVMDMSSCRPMGASVARLVILISGARSRSWN